MNKRNEFRDWLKSNYAVRLPLFWAPTVTWRRIIDNFPLHEAAVERFPAGHLKIRSTWVCSREFIDFCAVDMNTDRSSSRCILVNRNIKWRLTSSYCFSPKARRNAACRSISTSALNFYQYFLHNQVFIAKASHKLSGATWAFREMPANPMEREATLHYSPFISTRAVCVSNFLRFSRMASRLNLNSTFTYEYLRGLHQQRARKAVPSKAVCFERAYMSM